MKYRNFLNFLMLIEMIHQKMIDFQDFTTQSKMTVTISRRSGTQIKPVPTLGGLPYRLFFHFCTSRNPHPKPSLI